MKHTLWGGREIGISQSDFLKNRRNTVARERLRLVATQVQVNESHQALVVIEVSSEIERLPGGESVVSAE